MPKRRTKANSRPPRNPTTRKRRANPTPCREIDTQHAASYGPKHLDADALSAFPFSEDSILRQLNYMVPGQSLTARLKAYVNGRAGAEAEAVCCYDSCQCWCGCWHGESSWSEREYCTSCPSVGFLPGVYYSHNTTAGFDDDENGNVFDASAYFAPHGNSEFSTLALPEGMRDISVAGYSHDDDSDGEENLKYMTAAWWEGFVYPWDWRRERGQEWGQEHVHGGGLVAAAAAAEYMGIETCLSTPTLVFEEGIGLEQVEVEDEERRGNWRGGGIGRDSWECDFCGLECFCWTVTLSEEI